jgi:hypothetical protein
MNEEKRNVKKTVPLSISELKEVYGRSKFYPNLRCVPENLKCTIKRAGIIPTLVLPIVSDSAEEFIRKSSDLYPSALAVKAITVPKWFLPSRPPSIVSPITNNCAFSSSQASMSYPHLRSSLRCSNGAETEINMCKENDIFFVMGVDFVHGELTDCGGTRMKGELIEETAARELYEESAQLFDFRSAEWKWWIAESSPIITDGKMCIFFVRISPPMQYGFPTYISNDFQKNHSFFSQMSTQVKAATVRLENLTIYWIPSNELQEVSAVRTRKRVPKKGVIVSSPVEGFLMPAQVGDGKHHPLIYENVRRVLYPTLNHVLSFFRNC